MPSSVCRACGVRAVRSLPLPSDAPPLGGGDSPNGMVWGHAHTCLCCGDTRVSVWRFAAGQEEHINLHPCEHGPTLRQVGRVVALETGETTVDWSYYVDDIAVEADYWKTRLTDRQRLRLALVSN